MYKFFCPELENSQDLTKSLFDKRESQMTSYSTQYGVYTPYYTVDGTTNPYYMYGNEKLIKLLDTVQHDLLENTITELSTTLNTEIVDNTGLTSPYFWTFNSISEIKSPYWFTVITEDGIQFLKPYRSGSYVGKLSKDRMIVNFKNNTTPEVLNETGDLIIQPIHQTVAPEVVDSIHKSYFKCKQNSLNNYVKILSGLDYYPGDFFQIESIQGTYIIMSKIPSKIDGEYIYTAVLEDNSTYSFNGEYITPLITGRIAVTKYKDENEPTGWPMGSDGEVDKTQCYMTYSYVSGASGTLTYNISPTSGCFHYYINNKRFSIGSTKSISITGVQNIIPDPTFHFYMDNTGELKYTRTFDKTLLLYNNAYVANVIVSIKQQKVTLIGDERHGCKMDSHTHWWLHSKFGTIYEGGLTLTPSGALTTGKLSFTSGGVRDEDLLNVISQTTTTIPVLTRDSIVNWSLTSNTGYGYLVASGPGYILYNRLSDYSLQAIGNSKFVNYYYFATNGYEEEKKVVAVMGTTEYVTANAAKAGLDAEISSIQAGGVPFAEYRLIYAVTYKSSLGGAEEIIDYFDYRLSGVNNVFNPSNIASNISVDTTGFNGILTSADNTVQKALSTIDDHTHTVLGSLTVNSLTTSGTINATGNICTQSMMFVSGGVPVSSVGHNHDDRYYTETELTNCSTGLALSTFISTGLTSIGSSGGLNNLEVKGTLKIKDSDGTTDKMLLYSNGDATIYGNTILGSSTSNYLNTRGNINVKASNGITNNIILSTSGTINTLSNITTSGNYYLPSATSKVKFSGIVGTAGDYLGNTTGGQIGSFDGAVGSIRVQLGGYNTATSGNVIFDVVNSGWTQQLFSVKNSGNVTVNTGCLGIGTDTPSDYLDVQYNTVDYKGLYINNSNTGSVGATIRLKTGSSATTHSIFSRNGQLIFGRYGVADDVVITNGGNVGLGTSSATSKLHIVDSATNIHQIKLYNNSNSTTKTGNTTIGNWVGQETYIGNNSTYENGWKYQDVSIGSQIIRMSGGEIVFSLIPAGSVFTGGTMEKVKINTSGLVSITPSELGDKIMLFDGSQDYKIGVESYRSAYHSDNSTSGNTGHTFYTTGTTRAFINQYGIFSKGALYTATDETNINNGTFGFKADSSGNVTAKGFTSLGESALAVKTKTITATSPSGASTLTSTAHGLTIGKIRNVSVILDYTGNETGWIPPHHYSAGYQYDFYVDANNVNIVTNTSSGGILNKKVYITITYVA